MVIKVIVLDFDGVIVESNIIKHQAFSEIFSEYPRHYDELMSYHLAHNHVNRHEKFEFICGHILKGECSEGGAEKMAERFSAMTRQKIIDCPNVEGAADFIESFKDKCPLYLASATPREELELVLRERKLTGYFKGYYGAPMPKKEMFKLICGRENAMPAEVLFIGDSEEDYKCASEAGLNFIGRKNDFDFSKIGVRNFSDMSEIKKYLEFIFPGKKISG